MIREFKGKSETVEHPLCPTCKQRMTPWRQYCTTGMLPPDPNAQDLVYRFKGDLWACSAWSCRRGRRNDYDFGPPIRDNY